MKNPKSNFIGEAWRLRRRRMIIRGIIVGALILVVAFTIFFVKILNMKDEIDSEFTGTTTQVFTSDVVTSEASTPFDSSEETS